MLFLSNITFNWSQRVVILSFLSVFFSFITIILSESKQINSLLLKINHKSIHDDIWQDIIDYQNGTTLRFICNDAIYTGILVAHEEKGIDSWFILEDYIVEENGVTYASEDMLFSTRLALNLKDVKRIEVFYGNGKSLDNEKK